MFFYLSKIIYFFLQPIVWVIAFLFLGIISNSSKRRKRLIVGAISTLIIFSNPFIFHEFERAWEIPTSTSFEQEDTIDVAVILGGILSLNPSNDQLDFHSNSDRFLSILPLYFEGRVRKLLISGGSGSLLQEEVEAELLGKYLISIGVNKDDILLESKSRNTYENALFSKELIQDNLSFKKILLVTSAIHMKRSLLCFNKQGIAVIPFSVDGVENRKFYPDELLLPKAEILSDWYHLFHEWIGLLVYRIAGYC